MGDVRIIEPLLGTRAELAVTAASDEAEAAFEYAVVTEATRLEALFTVFEETSALHAYRRDGSTTVPELRTVLGLAATWRDRTAGAFHPAVQPLIDLWDEAEVAGAVPTDGRLAETAAAVRADTSGRAMNLNAIAKGWIADRALDRAFELVPDTSGAWLSIGGDVVHRGVGSVVVGIEDPHRPYDNVAPLATVEVANEALATSGGSRRWWKIDGRRYPKVLDPRTGHPAERVAGATVIAADGASADAIATAATVQTPAETLALVEDVGAACLLIDCDGVVTASSDRFRPSPTR